MLSSLPSPGEEAVMQILYRNLPAHVFSSPGLIQYAEERSDPLEREQHVALNLNHEKLKLFLLSLQKH